MLRILLIEDNPGDALIFREKIAASGLDAAIVHAKRLSDALGQLEAEAPFDLLLVDLSLPDAEGLEAVEGMRRAAPGVPLIVLTGRDDPASATEAKKRGAVDYLVKWYVDADALARYIRYAVEPPGRPRGAPPAPPAAHVEPARVEPARLAPPTQAPVEAPKPTAPLPASGPAAGTGAGDAGAVEPSGPADTPASDEAVSDGAVSDEAVFVQALEAALDVARQTAARADHLVEALGATLDLARPGGGARRPEARRFEALDVLALARQAADRLHTRALGRGVPLRVGADRKKVMARADRRALFVALDRLLALALETGCASGIEVTVAHGGAHVTVAAAWELCRGVRLDPPDEPLTALDLALCRRLATEAGGRFALAVEVAEAKAVFTLDAAGHE